MNRIVITFILFSCLFLNSGCIEVAYKSEVKVSLFKKQNTSRARTIANDYPYSPKPIPAVYAEPMYIPETEVETKTHKGFAKFNN